MTISNVLKVILIGLFVAFFLYQILLYKINYSSQEKFIKEFNEKNERFKNQLEQKRENFRKEMRQRGQEFLEDSKTFKESFFKQEGKAKPDLGEIIKAEMEERQREFRSSIRKFFQDSEENEIKLKKAWEQSQIEMEKRGEERRRNWPGHLSKETPTEPARSFSQSPLGTALSEIRKKKEEEFKKGVEDFFERNDRFDHKTKEAWQEIKQQRQEEFKQKLDEFEAKEKEFFKRRERRCSTDLINLK